MSTWKINLKEQTATSINGIIFKMTVSKSGDYEGLCLNPKDIPPDDMDDVILEKMVREARMFYRMTLEEREKYLKRLERRRELTQEEIDMIDNDPQLQG